MISITRRSQQALDVLIELGLADGDLIATPEIKRRCKLRESALSSIMTLLRDGALIKARRGVNGGFYLLQDPSSVTVADIVTLIEGPIGPDADGLFEDTASAIRESLAASTLADCIRRAQDAREEPSPMYWI